MDALKMTIIQLQILLICLVVGPSLKQPYVELLLRGVAISAGTIIVINNINAHIK